MPSRAQVAITAGHGAFEAAGRIECSVERHGQRAQPLRRPRGRASAGTPRSA